MDARDLERNVKRIVRDMRNGNIDEQDYIYFSNVRIISACINVSYREMRNANVTVLALQNYNSSYLYKYLTIWNIVHIFALSIKILKLRNYVE